MKYLLGIAFFILSGVAICQPIIIHNTQPGPNSAQTENAWKWAEQFEKEVKEAFAMNDLIKANYSLLQWDRTAGAKNSQFWQLKAEYCLKKGKKFAAKRYYMKAYNHYNCYECKDKCDAIIID